MDLSKTCPIWAVVMAILLMCVQSHGMSQEENVSSVGRPELSTLINSIGLTGSLRLGYWSATRDLDGRKPIGSAMLWAKSKHESSSHLATFGEAWLASRGPIDHGETRAELREAYLDLKWEKFELRGGRQVFAWGRADAINPTANLSGEDLTLLTPDSEDRKFGTTAIRTRFFLPHSLSLTGIWLPEFRPTRFPFPSLKNGTSFLNESSRWPMDQFAFRIDQAGRAVDWSLSYFDGYDLLPDLSAENESPDSEQVLISHHRVRVLGADAAVNIGHYGFRAEGAYTFTQNASGSDLFIKEPYLFVILGGDRTFNGELNVNLQYLFRFLGHSPPTSTASGEFAQSIATEEAVIGSQVQRVQQGASARVGDKWLHETLEGEIGAVGYFNPWGILVRPKVTYAISDHWKVIIGGEVYRGDVESVFGLLRSNSTGYAEARYSF